MNNNKIASGNKHLQMIVCGCNLLMVGPLTMKFSTLITGAAQLCIMCYGGTRGKSAHYSMFPNILIETFGDGGPGEAYSSSDCFLDV